MVAALPRCAAAAPTWSLRSTPTADNLADVVFSSAVTAVSVGANTAIFISDDAGETWNDPNPAVAPAGTPDLTSVDFGGANIAAASLDPNPAPQDETVVRSLSRGDTASWAAATFPTTDLDLNAIVFSAASTAITVGEGGEIYRSDDGADNWADVGFNAADDLLAATVRGNTVVAVGGDGTGGAATTIVRSADKGANWAAAANIAATNEDAVDVTFVNNSVAIAVGDVGFIYRSTDGGADWGGVTVDNGDGVDLNAVDASGNNVVVVGDAAEILYSTDAGATWFDPASNPATDNLNDVLFLTSSIVLAVGDDGEIVGSTDGGQNWTAQSSGVGVGDHLLAISFNGLNNTLVAGDGGIVLLSTNQISVSEPIPFRSKWPLVLLLVGAGLLALRRLRSAA